MSDPNPVMTLQISECDRQLILLALAKLSLERPGWIYTLTQLALTMERADTQSAMLFNQFREIHGPDGKRQEPAWEIALVESVRLQSHYAQVLNGWDGGARMKFESAADWIERLVQTGTIPEDRA